MSEETVDVVRRANDLFAMGESEQAMALTSEDLVSGRVEPDRAEYRGRGGFLAMMADWQEGLADWTFEAVEYVDAGDQVIVQLYQTARGAGSGVPVEGDFWLVYDVADGKITRIWIYASREDALAAAGVGA